MPARLTREQKKARTRSEVLRAAREVVARRGLNAATIDEIAEQAGFSHGAIYSNFASKDELVMALYEEFIQIRAEEISEPASEDDFVGGARRAANRWIELVSDDPEG